ncbi:MAG: DUF177 domain-containing protein [Oscillospiraceae bacterium]|nr:DUF177 domain-containing protein [Oscillospiraceae bacterium]
MRLNVKRIINTPGERLDFRFEMDLSDVDFGGVCPAVRPVSVVGQVRNAAGVLLLDMEVATVLQSVCDRCAREFENDVSIPFSAMLAEQLENGENDEIVLLEGDEVDLGELARTVFILGMDTKTLCSEDCKGLCAKCGANLNDGPCSCKADIDPRWAALGALLNRDE